MFWKGFSLEDDGPSTDGLLCEEPILKELSLLERGFQGGDWGSRIEID